MLKLQKLVVRNILFLDSNIQWQLPGAEMQEKERGSSDQLSENTVTPELLQKLFEQMENNMEAFEKRMDERLQKMKVEMTQEVKKWKVL